MKSSDIKRQARFVLDGRWGISILATLIASAFGASSGASVSFGGGSYGGSGGGSSSGGSPSGGADVPMDETILSVLITFVVIVLMIGFAVAIAQFVVGSAVWVGYSKFTLVLADGREKVNLGMLFKYFGKIKTAFVTRLLQTLYISLWSLLFIIPGIVASYSYALTGFILAENPHYTAREALSESKRIMKGRKGRLFALDMSFFGWHCLCMLSLGIGYIWLAPYIQASYAVFYREVMNEENAYVNFLLKKNEGDSESKPADESSVQQNPYFVAEAKESGETSDVKENADTSEVNDVEAYAEPSVADITSDTQEVGDVSDLKGDDTPTDTTSF